MQLSERLFPSSNSKPVCKMPDYAYVHKELQRSDSWGKDAGVSISERGGSKIWIKNYSTHNLLM